MSSTQPDTLFVPGSRRFLLATLVFLTSTKILLMPAYRSTDFDVHRNWLALTRTLPLQDWYFDDRNQTTVHTLDYPPSFAYFEYLLSTNFLTDGLLERGWVEDRCLQPLSDDDNSVSMACVVFHRSSVILSDLIFYWGAWVASSSTETTKATTATHTQRQEVVTTFLLLILNPGLLWLDHVHFQYNGMLLGILLASVGYLERGMQRMTSDKSKRTSTPLVLMSAALYALLLTLKHLYLPLAPLYFVFLLRHYCCSWEERDDKDHSSNNFSIRRFLPLAVVTLTTLLLPLIPFLNATQLPQLASRLFPFQRGLVHDYWAANVWAIYEFLGKVVLFVSNQIGSTPWFLPDVPASVAALFLLLSLLPVLSYAATAQSRHRFTHMVVYTSFSSFMLAYHVHEKAILTTLLPMTLLVVRHDNGILWKRLLLRTLALGLFGLWPLLFRPVELLMKVSSYVCYMAFSVFLLQTEMDDEQQKRPRTPLLTTVDYAGAVILCGVAVFLEVLHPLFVHPRMEFLPLMLTSITCALGLVLCWIQSYRLMTMQDHDDS